jgi:hypothetical protein
MNAIEVFDLRKLYRERRFGSTGTTKLLPVKVSGERFVEDAEDSRFSVRWGTMEIRKRTVLAVLTTSGVG